MHRLPARAALYVSSPCSSAKAHWLACRLARRAFLDTKTSCLPLRRRERRFVRSRMPVSASRPMKAEGMVARIRLLMVWLVFSLSRLSRWRSHDAAPRGATSALSAPVVFAGGRNGPPGGGSPFPSRNRLDCPASPRQPGNDYPHRCPRSGADVLG